MEVSTIHVVQESFYLIIYNGNGFHRMFRNWAILPLSEHTTLSYWSIKYHMIAGFSSQKCTINIFV